jgi:hypothetical protein
LFAALAFAALAWLLPSQAQAYEYQWHAGAGLGYAALWDTGFSPGMLHGFGGGLHLTYGLTDAFNLKVVADVAGHPGTAGVPGSETDLPRPDVLVFGGAAGVGYVIDILQIIPEISVLAGGYDVLALGLCGAAGTPPCHSGRLSLTGQFSLDYQINPSFAVGVAGRGGVLLFGTPQPAGVLSVFARAEYIWGF